MDIQVNVKGIHPPCTRVRGHRGHIGQMTEKAWRKARREAFAEAGRKDTSHHMECEACGKVVAHRPSGAAYAHKCEREG